MKFLGKVFIFLVVVVVIVGVGIIGIEGYLHSHDTSIAKTAFTQMFGGDEELYDELSAVAARYGIDLNDDAAVTQFLTDNSDNIDELYATCSQLKDGNISLSEAENQLANDLDLSSVATRTSAE